MSDELTPTPAVYDALKDLTLILKAIACHAPPNWQRPLKAYKNFDWAKIGATAIAQDAYGATKVAWCGHVYTRRSGENKKFGAAIWFSRANGKGEGDENTYLKLISFRDGAEAEPLPDYVVQRLR
jgi:hypothetical protein